MKIIRVNILYEEFKWVMPQTPLNIVHSQIIPEPIPWTRFFYIRRLLRGKGPFEGEI